MPISGWIGDNLIKKSENMAWWKGMEVAILGDAKNKVLVQTLYDVLDKMVKTPERKLDAPMRTPLSGVYKIKGVGDVLTGRVEQGAVKPNDEVVFLPTHTTSTPCSGKVFTVEMHHKQVPLAGPGDNVGMNVKGLTSPTCRASAMSWSSRPMSRSAAPRASSCRCRSCTTLVSSRSATRRLASSALAAPPSR